MNTKSTILFVLMLITFLGSCSKATPPAEWFPNMFDSPARESQEADYFASNNSASRIPPEGTIPLGYEPYPYSGVATSEELQGEDKGLKNPIEPGKEAYTRGEERYQIYCSPCHGVRGAGNGNVVGPYPKFVQPPPALISEKIKGWTDGQIYHIITIGRGLMGSYSYQITPEDRWKLILYIRKLQEHDSKVSKQ